MPRSKLLARAIVSALLIWIVLRKVDWAGLAAVLVHLDLRWAMFGSVLTSGLIATLALRWSIFLAQQKISVPYGTVFLLTWAGQFFNSILPGSTGGDVMKIVQICRISPARKAAAVSTVFVDRLSAFLALLLLAFAAILLDPRPLRLVPVPRLDTKIFLLGLIVLLGAAGGAWLTFRLLRGTQLGGRITRTIAAARETLVFSPGIVAAVLLAFGVHLLNFLIVYIFARALRIEITFAQLTLLMPVILFCVMIPITINGHGLREFLLVGYFTLMGVGIAGQPHTDIRATAVALSLVVVANDLLWSLPGGLWYLLRFREKRAATALGLKDAGVLV